MGQLLKDPASRFHAAAFGWAHPMSREGLYQLDTMDLLIQRWSERGKAGKVIRPSDPATKRQRAVRVSDPARLEKFKVKWREPS